MNTASLGERGQPAEGGRRDAVGVRRFDRGLLDCVFRGAVVGRVTRTFRHAAWVEQNALKSGVETGIAVAQGKANGNGNGKGKEVAGMVTLLDAERLLVPYGVVLPRGMGMPVAGSRVVLQGRGGCCGGQATAGVSVLGLDGPGVSLDSRQWPTGVSPTLLDNQFARIRARLPGAAKRFLRCLEEAEKSAGGKTSRPSPRSKDGVFTRRRLAAELECRIAAGGVRLLAVLGEIFKLALRDTDEAKQSRSSEQALQAACGGLVGLGDGLTPSGDDVLVAVAAACRRWGGLKERSKNGVVTHGAADGSAGIDERFNDMIALDPFDAVDWMYRRRLAALPFEKTTRPSAQMLRWAAAGVFGEPLIRLLGALGDKDAPDAEAERAAAALLAVGGRSGRDMLCTILFFGPRLAALKRDAGRTVGKTERRVTGEMRDGREGKQARCVSVEERIR